MKSILPIIFLLIACSPNSKKEETKEAKDDSILVSRRRIKDLSDPSNTLTGKTETLILYYIVWGCACANWVTPEDLRKYNDNGLSKHSIFLEPANPELDLPLYFDPSRHYVKVTGQFYVKPDYPKGTEETEEHLDKAKVFRYLKIEIIKKDLDYSPKDDTTLYLHYNAIECTCAQWGTDKPVDERKFYFLEPANNKLINSDSLWKGDNLPLIVKVTGQVISDSGYPTGYNPPKGDPRPEPVFRYTKLKIIKNGSSKKH